ncbi:hypothetical protein ACO0SA_002351 [Hanseniaspora valbyensis]
MTDNSGFAYYKGYEETIKQEECERILDDLISNPNMVSDNTGNHSNGHFTSSISHQIPEYGKNYQKNDNNFDGSTFLPNNNLNGFELSNYQRINSDNNMFNQEINNLSFKNTNTLSVHTEKFTPDIFPSIKTQNDSCNPNSGDSSVNNTSKKVNMDLQNENLTEEEKKKKINRDAQRAFRQRKEEKLKLMEEKWKNSENDKKHLLKEIEELRKITYDMSQENRELLRKHSIDNNYYTPDRSTSDSSASTNNGKISVANKNTPLYNFPNRTEYVQFIYENSRHVLNTDISELSDMEYRTNDGEQAMTVPKTWEYLLKTLHEKEQEGYTFDTWHIMSVMKGNEVCHGSGAAYMKSFVDSVLKDNMREL